MTGTVEALPRRSLLRRRRRRRAAVAVLVVGGATAAVLVGGVGVGGPDRTGPPGSVPVSTSCFGDLGAAAPEAPAGPDVPSDVVYQKAVRSLAADLSGRPGYSQMSEAQRVGALLLLWKAPVPDAVEAMAGTRPDGVRLVVVAVAHSTRELALGRRLAQHRVAADGRSDVAVNVCPDRSGLQADVYATPIDSDAYPSASDLEALRLELTEVAGVPVTVLPSTPGTLG